MDKGGEQVGKADELLGKQPESAENLSGEPSTEDMRRENEADDAKNPQGRAAGTVPAEQASSSRAVATEAPPPPKGTQRIGPEDVQLPRIDFDGRKGVFRDSLTEETFDSIAVVPLFMSKSRVYFYDPERRLNPDPGSFGDAVILCKSPDAMAPSDWHPDFWATFGLSSRQICDGCPFAKWGPNKERPNCRVNYNFLCVRPNEVEPFRMSFHGTSLQAVRKLLAQVKRSRRPMFAYIQQLGIEERTIDRNSFYSLTVGVPEWIKDEDLPYYEAIYDQVFTFGDAEVVDILGGGRSIQASGTASSNGNG